MFGVLFGVKEFVGEEGELELKEEKAKLRREFESGPEPVLRWLWLWCRVLAR